MKPDGSDRRLVVPEGVGVRIVSAPSWFAGDSRILFVARGSDPGYGGLVWHSVDGTQRGEIPLPGGLPVWSASVSPDGTRIALAAGRPEESTEGIYTVGIDGTGLRRLTGGFGTDQRPFWSPDGTMIAFTNHYQEPAPIGTWRAIVMNADGTGGRLIRSGVNALGWSPDGRSFLVGDGGRVLTVNLDGSGGTPLGGCRPLRPWSFSWQPVPTAPARTVQSSGWNGVGQLGNGTTVDRLAYAPIGLNGAVAVAAGYYHSLALRADGTVWAWGWNAVGQLGNGTTSDSHVPVRVPGLANVTCVAAGAFHSLAVMSDGSVWGWGWNHFGQLGDGTTVDALRPRPIPGLRGESVAAGIAHSLALDGDGSAWAWGWNGLGQVGTGSAYDSHRPEPIMGPAANRQAATLIAAGAHHSLVAVAHGVLGWGWNEYGQLGNRTDYGWVIPVAVEGLGGGVTDLAAGGFHSLAVKADGTLWGWGDNSVGELGIGSGPRSLEARQVTQIPRVSAVQAGLLHSLAISGSALYTWGWNPYGQLGTATLADRSTPAPVVAPPVHSIAGGALHTLLSWS